MYSTKNTGKNKMEQTNKITCFLCRKKVSQGKRWYHGDQDDLICLECAEKTKQIDTCYAGQMVSNMQTETFGEN